MPRPKRGDEANGIYHALNRGNARSAIFKKDADYNAFERILAEGLERYLREKQRCPRRNKGVRSHCFEKRVVGIGFQGSATV